MEAKTTSEPHIVDSQLLDKHARWWRREGLLYAEVPHAPLGPLWLPLAGGRIATEDVDLRPDMLDMEQLVGEDQKPGALTSRGDHIETAAPFAPVPWVEAVLGCPIRASIGGGAMRAQAWVRHWDDWGAGSHWRQEWVDALLQMTSQLVARSGGRYAVTQTLMRGPSDLAEAVLGPERTCLAMYDHPSELSGFLDTATDVFVRLLRAQLERIPPIEDGYVNPFGVWAPGTVVRTQCDASAFLSPRQYAQWFLPYDVRTSEAADYAVIHLHSGSLHTIEPLLEVERPQAIQVTIDPPPSAPPVRELLPRFRRALEAKCLIIDGILTREEIALLLRELPHDGLYILARFDGW